MEDYDAWKLFVWTFEGFEKSNIFGRGLPTSETTIPALCVCVVAATGAFLFYLKKTRPWIFEHVFCEFCYLLSMLGSPGNKNSKDGPSAQMTMPARRAPKFLATRRDALLHIIFPRPIS